LDSFSEQGACTSAQSEPEEQAVYGHQSPVNDGGNCVGLKNA
jgi:hypothetical protein